MRKKVVIIAAPFGYGPVSRALLLAQALTDVADVTIVSSGDAYRFATRFMDGPVVGREGIFRTVYANAADLAPFDLFISVNNDPAVHHLVNMGFEARTLFVDSILAWRSVNSPMRFRKPILGYLAQDFPGVANGLAGCQAQIVALTAPIVWNSPGVERARALRAGSAAGDQVSRARAAPVTLHLGGVTSPLVSWEMLRRPIEEIFRSSVALARRHGRKLVVVGSHRLADLSVGDDDVEILGDVSPPEAAARVADSEILLSTPGIGAVYEALAARVPLILLPPMNSTQLIQYGVFAQRGFAGSMHARASAVLLEAAKSIPWDKQTAYGIDFLNRNVPAALAELPRQMARLLGDDTTAAARQEAQRVQAAFLDTLSRTSAIEVLRKVVLDA